MMMMMMMMMMSCTAVPHHVLTPTFKAMHLQQLQHKATRQLRHQKALLMLLAQAAHITSCSEITLLLILLLVCTDSKRITHSPEQQPLKKHTTRSHTVPTTQLLPPLIAHRAQHSASTSSSTPSQQCQTPVKLSSQTVTPSQTVHVTVEISTQCQESGSSLHQAAC
jgi:hypothetical protein